MEEFSLQGSVMERRRKPRISQPFHVRVSGKDTGGDAFEISTVLDNMSSAGIYLKLDRSVDLGKRLNMVIRLSTSIAEEEIAKVAVETVVVRRESLANQLWGLALLIVKRRFL
jgi:hypothetical protein